MCGMEYRLKKGSVYEGKVEKVDWRNPGRLRKKIDSKNSSIKMMD